MDEQVVGGGGGGVKTDIPLEYAEAQPVASEDHRPIKEKIVDKSWKARIAGYEELKRNIVATTDDVDDTDALFAEYASFLSKMASDAHPGALDIGLETALVFVDKDAKLYFKEHAEKIATSTIDKCFGGRSQDKGKLLLMKMMEVDDCNIIVPILLSKLNEKKPKIPPLCIEVLQECVVCFGIKALPVKDMIGSFQSVMDGSNAAARENTISLICEMTRWIGKTPLMSLVDNMRPAQKADFEKFMSELNSVKPTPTLYLRKERPAVIAISSDNADADAASSINGNVSFTAAASDKYNDAGREYVDDIDLVKKLKATEYSTLLSSDKWEPQLKAMQLIIDALSPVPKIVKGTDLTDIVQTIKVNLRQGHITVQVASMKVIGLLADGARNEFSGLARSISQMMIMKCKEKKLCSELTSSLTLIVKHCLGFESLYEDFNEQIRSKKVAVHGRLCLLEFLLIVLKEHTSKLNTDQLKPIAELMIFSCEDSDPKIRDVCTAVLVALGSLINARGKGAQDARKLLSGLEQSNQRVFKKIKTAMDGPTETATATVPTAKSGDVLSTNTKKVSSASSNVTKKQTTAIAVKTTSTDTSASTTTNDDHDDNVEELSMTLEGAIEVMNGLGIDGWMDKVQDLMKSSKWQERVEALTLLENAIKTQEAGGLYSSAFVVYLYESFSKFQISNINLVKAVIQAATTAAQNVGTSKFSKPAAWMLIKEFGEKLSDKKISPIVTCLLSALSEALSPAFVCKSMKKVIDKAKAPVAHQVFLEWTKDSIKEFGANMFPVQVLCAFCIVELENRDGKVRSSAVEVLGALYNTIGPKLQSIVFASDDMKPALRNMIESEFSRVGYDSSIKATRAVKCGVDDGAVGFGDIARQDLSNMLDKTFLKDVNLVEGKESWKKRKEAIEAVIAACGKSGFYLDATKSTVEIMKALKSRLVDTNANLKPLAATAIANIIASLEPENGAKLLRAVAGALVGTLGDNKQQMRSATIAALQMIVTMGKTDPVGDVNPLMLNVLVPFMTEVVTSNPVGRMENLSWLNQHEHLISGKGNKDENVAADIATACVAAMQDKIAGVRLSSESLLAALMSRGVVTKNMLDRATRDLPTATKRSLQPVIDRMNSSALVTKKVTAYESSVPNIIAGTAINSEVAAKSTLSHKLSEPLSPKRSAVASSSTSSSVPALGNIESQFTFKKTNKIKRMEEFSKMHWPSPPEDVTESEMTVLKSQWELCLDSRDGHLSSLLFPVIKKGGFLNQDALDECILELTKKLQEPHIMDHSDFILRWSTWALTIRETSRGLLQVLNFIALMFEIMLKNEDKIHDNEVAIVLPHLIEKSGHKSERHKAAFITCLRAAGEIVAPNKLCQFFIQGLQCKNKKTRVVCIEEIQTVVEGAGAGSLGRPGIKEIGGYLDSKDNDVAGRHACLELAYTLCISLNSDQGKLIKLLGDISEKSQAMVEERIRQKLKDVASTSTATGVNTAPAATVVATASTPKRSSPNANVDTNADADHRDDVTGDELDISMDGSPFQLDITPPGTEVKPLRPPLHDECDSPIVNDVKPIEGSVLVCESTEALTPKVSTLDKLETAVDAGNSGTELDGIYADIASTLSALVVVQESISELNELHDDAREYLKMLHLVVTGAWAKETLPEDEEALSRQAEPMIVLLLRCLDRSFRYPSITSLQQQQLLGIDLSLSSLALANLYAYVSREDVVLALSEDCIVSIFGHCIERLIDSKLKYTSDGGGGSSGNVDLIDDADFGFTRSVADLTMVDTAHQLTRALNILVLRLAQQAPVTTVFASLLRLIKGCIPEIKHESSVKKIISPGSKVISRLILRVVSDEVSRMNSFQRDDAMMKRILYGLHCFFNGHPEVTADEIPFCTAKTLLDQVMKSVGGEKVASIMNGLSLVTELSYPVPKNSLLSKLVSKYLTAINSNDNAAHGTTKDHQEMVNIIDDITSARDKSVPIQKLHHLISANPDIDVHAYLQRISSAFRKFVLDALTKLDDGKALKLSAERAAQKNTTVTVSGNVIPDGNVSTSSNARDDNNADDAGDAGAMSTSTNAIDISAANNGVSNQMHATATSISNVSANGIISDLSGGSEAMRIIEGLRQNRITATIDNDTVHNNTSSLMSQSVDSGAAIIHNHRPLSRVPENTQMPRNLSRTQMNEKVRNSLNTLTSSLDLSSSVGSGSESSTSTSVIGDDDLAARLNRLRNITKTAPAGTATISPPSAEIVSDN